MQRKMQASSSPAEEVVDLREYAAVLRRRKWLILFVTGIFTALMGAYSFSKAPMYTAQSTVYVQPASTSAQFRPDQLVSLDTESRLVKSAPVAIIAQGMLGWDLTIPQLLKRVSVETTPDTLVLDIFFTDGQRNDAAEGANAFAKAYLQYKQDRAIASAVEARTQVQTLIDEQTDQRDKLDRKLQSLDPGHDRVSGRPDGARHGQREHRRAPEPTGEHIHRVGSGRDHLAGRAAHRAVQS